MPDRKQIYLTLIDTVEEAIDRLIAVERTCEQLYLTAAEEEDKEGE